MTRSRRTDPGTPWLGLLRRATEAVSSSLDLAALQRAVLEFCKETLDAEAASLLLRDEDTGELLFDIALGEAGDKVKTLRLPRGQGVAGWVAEGGEPLWVPDTAADPRFTRQVDDASAFMTRSILAVPLRVAGRVTGVLEVLNQRDGGCFSLQDLATLDALSGLVAMAVDHARRLAEVQGYNRDLEARVAERSEELRWVQARLAHTRHMAGLGQLAAGVAHEINNPLGFVTANLAQLERNFATLLDPDQKPEEWLAEEVGELFGEIREGVGRVATIVQQLREFTGVDTSGRDTVDLARCLADTCGRARRPEGVSLAWRCEPDLPPLVGDGPRLAQALLNVLDNAVQAAATATHRKVELNAGRLSRGGRDGVAIRVRDQGAGMDPEVAERAFEPFFTTKPVGQGTGLGLSEVYAVAVDHGGSAEIDSQPGQGCCLTLWLPSATEEAHE